MTVCSTKICVRVFKSVTKQQQKLYFLPVIVAIVLLPSYYCRERCQLGVRSNLIEMVKRVR